MKFGALKNGSRHGYVSSDERDSDQGWETVENVQELLSEEEKELVMLTTCDRKLKP